LEEKSEKGEENKDASHLGKEEGKYFLFGGKKEGGKETSGNSPICSPS